MSKALWRQTRGEASGVGTLEGVVTNLHTGGSSHRVVPHCTGAAVESGSRLND